MAQTFRATLPTANTNIFQDNVDQINNDNTLRSLFSGTAFPTNPAPVVGQPCYRTDLKKLFIYTTDGWVEIMGKPIYDPRSISADVFHMDNMTEGANTKIMTAEERDKIIALENDVSTLENDVSKLNNRTWDVILEDRKPAGVAGGTFDPGDWRTRDLNTIVFNTGILISLSNNFFTLPVGTYCIDWDAPAYKVDGHKTRLWNHTDQVGVAIGTVQHASQGYDGNNRSFGTTVITLTKPTAFTIQHICSSGQGNHGFGPALNAYTEVYTRVRIKRIA